MTDKEIVDGCIEGRRSAQKALYDNYATKMMGLVRRYVKSQDDAQDVLQEAFIKIYNNIQSYQGKGPLGGWIRTIMINTSLIHLRKNKNWAHTENVEDIYDLKHESESALDSMSAKELLAIIDQMPLGYKTVFNLYAIEGYKHKEIAEQLNITESTSKTQYRKAKSYIQKILQEIENTI